MISPQSLSLYPISYRFGDDYSSPAKQRSSLIDNHSSTTWIIYCARDGSSHSNLYNTIQFSLLTLEQRHSTLDPINSNHSFTNLSGTNKQGSCDVTL